MYGEGGTDDGHRPAETAAEMEGQPNGHQAAHGQPGTAGKP